MHFTLVSLRAMTEFSKLIPSKIDRHSTNNGIYSMFPNSIVQLKSDEEWRTRKNLLINILDLKFSASFTPLMLYTLNRRMENWVPGDEIDLHNELSHSIFSVLVSMLFGKDIILSETLYNYTFEDGSVKQISLKEFFEYLCKDLANSDANNLINFTSNRRNKQNMNSFLNNLKSYLLDSKDLDSAYVKLLKASPADENDILTD